MDTQMTEAVSIEIAEFNGKLYIVLYDLKSEPLIRFEVPTGFPETLMKHAQSSFR